MSSKKSFVNHLHKKTTKKVLQSQLANVNMPLQSITAKALQAFLQNQKCPRKHDKEENTSFKLRMLIALKL